MALQQFLTDLKDDLEQDGLRRTAVELHEEYGIDQKELGKIIIIASLALMVASIPSALTLQKAHDQVKAANNDYNQVQGIIQSDRFQSNMKTLQSRVGGNIGRTISQIAEALRDSNENMEKLEGTESNLEERADTYRWLSLISILGLVSGIVTIYV